MYTDGNPYSNHLLHHQQQSDGSASTHTYNPTTNPYTAVPASLQHQSQPSQPVNYGIGYGAPGSHFDHQSAASSAASTVHDHHQHHHHHHHQQQQQYAGSGMVNPYASHASYFQAREYVLDEPWYEPCTAVAVDTHQEVLWAGYEDGRLASFQHPSMELYTRFEAHKPGDGGGGHHGHDQRQGRPNPRVLHIMPMASGVISLSPTRINVHHRGGVFAQQLQQGNRQPFVDLRCAALFRNRNLVAASGGSSSAGAGSGTHRLHLFDLAYSTAATQVTPDFDSPVVALTYQKYLYAGCANGNVLVYDTRAGIDAPVQTVHQAQKGKVRDLAVQNSTLVTCGTAERGAPAYHGRYHMPLLDADDEAPDLFVNVFDTRMVQSTRQLQSLRFEDSAQMLDAAGTPTPLTPHLSSADQSGPAFLRFVPDRQHVLLAASRAGILRTYNLTTLRAVGPASLVNCRANFMDAESGSLCSMSQVSESGNVVLFGDTNGGVHAWSTESGAHQHLDAGDGSNHRVGSLNAMVWEPEPRPEPTKVGHRSEILLELSGGGGGTGLSFQQQQQQQKRLERPPLVPPRCASPGSALAFLQHLQLSEFPQCLSDSMLEAAKRDLLPRSGLPIVRIRPDLLNAQQRPSNTLAFIDNRKWELPRNGFIYQTDPKLQGYVSHLDPRGGDLSTQNFPGSGSAEDGAFFAAASSFRLPQPWQRQRIDVSKLRFGFDGFDFGRFNKTMFAGLENLLPDSYINSIIQMIYHIPSVRDALLRHVCGRTGCLACELGFLFDMLDQARNLPPRRRSVQATNFLGALRLKPTTKILGLLKETYAGDMDDAAAAVSADRAADTSQYGVAANAALAPSIGSAAVVAEDGSDYLNLRAGKFLSFLMAQLQDDSSYQPPKHVKDFSNSLMLQSGDPGSAANDSAEAAEVMNVIHSRFGFEADIRSTCRRNHVQVVSVPVLEVDLTYDGLSAESSATNSNSGSQATSMPDSFKEADTSVAAAILARSALGVLETGEGETAAAAAGRAVQPKSVFTFADILEASLCPRKSTQAWCNGCKKYVPLQQRSCPSSLPEILLVNCNISSERLRQEFWVNHPNSDPAAAAASAAARAAVAAERGINPHNSHDVPNLVVPPLLELELVEPIDSLKHGDSDSTEAAGEGKVRVRATDAAHLDAGRNHESMGHEASTNDNNSSGIDSGFTTPKRSNRHHRHQGKAGRNKNRTPKNGARRKDNDGSDPSAGKTRRRVYELRVIVSHIREKHSDTLSDGHLVTHVRPFVRPPDAAGQEQSAGGGGGGVPMQTTPSKGAKSATNSSTTSDVPSSAAAGAGANQDWYIFNDFYVAKQDVRDVFNFRNDWRTCCLLAYIERDACVAIDQVLQQRPASISPLKEQVFEPSTTPLALKHGNLESTQAPSTPLNSAMQALAASAGSDTPSREASGAFAFRSSPQQLRRSKVVVDLNDLPGRGDPVAIDCEFVSLADEDTFISAEGRRVVHREAQLGLGRVSCLDGRGTEAGKCFIDDYIINNEPIVDYLTRFSGLKPGDLDPATSQHHLVTLKIAYLKLRHLVQRGCIFIGHGLKKDFRIINMLVPACQIQDTVELFYQQNNRRISLRFLAAYLLKQDIQSDNHDSIQDARTALLCYRRYLELRESGKLASTIQDIYNQGYKTKWKEVNGITVT